MSIRMAPVLLSVFLCACSQKPVTTSTTTEDKVADARRQVEEAQAKLAAAEAEARKNQPAAPVESPAAQPAAPRTVAPVSPARPAASVRKFVQFTIPAGTPIAVRTTNTLSTKTQQNGEAFVGSLESDLVVKEVVVAKKGATVNGVVVNSDDGGRVKGRASIAVAVRSIEGVHGPIKVQTGSYTVVAKSTVKRDVVRGGIMTGAGAAIGAIAGGARGAAIGAGVGAGAGAGTAVATKGDPATIPAESVLRLKTTAAATVTSEQ